MPLLDSNPLESQSILLRILSLFLLVAMLVGTPGCQENSAPNRHLSRSGTVIDSGNRNPDRNETLGEAIRPSKLPEALSRLIETIQSRKGKVTLDETGIVAIDWHRAPIDNLDLELLTETPALNRLYLSGTRIDSRGWVYLASLRNLERLALWNTPITDDDLQYLAGAKRLQVLDLSRTNLKGDGLKHLGNCQALEELILKGSVYLGEEGLPAIARLRSLRMLDIRNTFIIPSTILPLKVLPKLEEIHALFTPPDVHNLEEFPNIRRLKLLWNMNPYSKQTIAAIRHMKRLERLEIVGGLVPDEFLVHVVRCENLRELHVGMSRNITDAGVTELVNCPTLQLLDVRGTGATLPGLQKLAQSNSQLRILTHPIRLYNLQDAFQSMGLDAKHSRDRGPRLHLDRELNIIALRLEDAKVFLPSLQLIAKSVDSERLLQLGLGYSDLTDEGLALFRAGSRLQTLNLRDTKITPKGLKSFGGGQFPELRELQNLDLSGTTLDEECLMWIGTLNNLKTLRLAKVKGVSEKGWKYLESLPNLDVLEK